MVRINAKFIKQILIDMDIDQQVLAQRSGLSEPTISRIMNGRPFTSETLGKLAKALDCHPVDLIEANGFHSPHVDASPVTASGT